MLGPKTDNTITDGDGNTQFGHNSGTVIIGLTFEQHQAALEKALHSKTQDLERAHSAERALLQAEVDALRQSLADIDKSYQLHVQELVETKTMLARFSNQIDQQKLDAANAALDLGETTLAQALFKELATQARNRRQDASTDEAAIEFKLGQIAEAEIRWQDAATHYTTAAHLNPNLETLQKASELSWRIGDYSQALLHCEALLVIARASPDLLRLSQALNNLAIIHKSQGRFSEAEAVYRETLKIASSSIGESNSMYSIYLNNLANVLVLQGRNSEAETHFRQSLEIDRKTIGENHPNFSKHLNNLASLLHFQDNLAEAETLFRHALEIARTTIGEAHPDFAMVLSNLGIVLQSQDNYAEAEPLFSQSLLVYRQTLGDTHPDTQGTLQDYITLLDAHRPDAAELTTLRALVQL